jgi:transcriptional regulator with XRE-family HTH domain
MDIGPLVAAARTRAGLTQQELARRAGTSQSAIARLERGQGSPSVDTLRRVLAAAGFSLRIDLQPAGPTGDPVVEAYKAGVDRTLIRANLAKTVERRLDDVEAFRKSAAELRASVARMRRRR